MFQAAKQLLASTEAFLHTFFSSVSVLKLAYAYIQPLMAQRSRAARGQSHWKPHQKEASKNMRNSTLDPLKLTGKPRKGPCKSYCALKKTGQVDIPNSGFLLIYLSKVVKFSNHMDRQNGMPDFRELHGKRYTNFGECLPPLGPKP